MVDPQTSRFWQAALQSGLIDVEGLTACFDALPPEKRTADQIDRRLARQAVQAGLLSLWQAQQLLSGRSTGFKIDRYVLLEMIGQGGMGRVYLAKDSRLNRRVALKILSPERVNNPRAIARFQREARVGAQLQHENLVRIYDEGESNGKCYLVMEYIEGKNVGGVIAENGRIAPSTAARLARQVALGLEHAQQKGLIHRDVNPFNILVTHDGTAKLTDLGLAIDLAEEGKVTRDGATVGTFDYVSPEQARHSHSVDTRSDIYSLGCTLYHMITGQVPFPSPSLPEKLFGHQALEPEPMTTVAPGVPEGLAEVVRKMMRKSPDDRYASPIDVAQALEPYVDEQAANFRSDGPSTNGNPSPATQTATRITAFPRELDERAVGEQISFAPPDSEPVDNDLAGLGLALNFGPEPSLSEGTSLARPKPRAKPPAPAASVAPPPKANAKPESKPAPKVPAPSVPPPDGLPDFARIGEEPAADQGFSGLDLALNLGAAPPLAPSSPKANATAAPGARAESRPAGAATAPAPKPKAAVTSANTQGAGVDRRLIVGGAAALLLAAVALGLFAGGFFRGSGKPTPSKGTKAKPSTAIASAKPADLVPSPAKRETTSTDVPSGLKGRGIVVKAGDGEVTTEPDLKNAMLRAIGSRGHVLLNNSEPLKFSGAAAAITVGGGKPLIVRAAEGTRPVLDVEIKGPNPFLAVKSDTPLTLIGVTIVARYVEPSQEPPPLIASGSSVRLERCSFEVQGDVKGSRAVVAEGGTLTAIGCWFLGFDKALDVAAFGGGTTTIRQCMMIRTGSEGQALGWALRVRSMPGGFAKTQRRLNLDHCTVRGAGLLDLVDFSSRAPYKVEVKNCAVRADALVAWEPSRAGVGDPLSPEAFQWSGVGNQYDIRGKSWLVSSSQAMTAASNGPTDLDSWIEHIHANELDTLKPPVAFLNDAAAPARPQDFAVADQGGRSAGAAPGQVGPAMANDF